MPQHRIFTLLLTFTLLITFSSSSFALLGIGESKEPDEQERLETIERIEDVQGKLKLLQEKLKALERRKAARQAAERAAGDEDAVTEATPQVNWLPVDETVTNPGDFGLYTYVLFIGDAEDLAAVGSLEDLLLTLETLPESDPPESLANCFLVPVERPQSTINLGQQPYDFDLNRAYLNRLQLRDSLPDGPVLVSLPAPIDPYGAGDVPAFLAVSLGRQKPGKTLELAKIWHKQEKPALEPTGHPVAGLFWELLDGAGTSRVSRYAQRVLMELSVR